MLVNLSNKFYDTTMVPLVHLHLSPWVSQHGLQHQINTWVIMFECDRKTQMIVQAHKSTPLTPSLEIGTIRYRTSQRI